MQITNTTTGAYTYTELKPLDHPTPDQEDNIVLNLTYQAKDGSGDTATGVLHVTVNDDLPAAANDEVSVTAGTPGKFDVVCVLDVSESMSGTDTGVASDFGYGNTRLDVARLALLQLVDQESTDQVQIILFRGLDRQSIWMSKDAAITFINNAANFDNSTLGTGTDYDAALFDNGAGHDKGASSDAFDNFAATPGDGRLVYFLSDGEPNEPGGADTGIQAGEETTWINYLTTNNVRLAAAVGFGSATVAPL